MTAASSPYAPPSRNSFLRHSRSPALSNFQVAKKRKVTILLAFFLFVLKFWRDVATRQRVWNWLKERPIGAKVIGWIQHNLLGTFRGENPDRRMENITRNVRPTSSITIPNESRRIAMANDHSETSFPIPDQLSVSSVTKRVRDNHVSIKSVLHYWFGQCAPDNSQKMLWMIAASSVQQRTKVDQEITERFQNTLIELAAPSSRLWSEWCHDPDGIYGASGKIAAMIVLDQFSRHMQRHYQNPLYENGSSSSIPAQSKLDSLALETAQLFTQIHKDEIACGMIPLPMYIFSLMPFRHQGTVESVEYVQSCIEASDSMNAQMDAMLRRFRKATNRRMAVLQDEARRTGGKTKAETKDATVFSDEDILETFPFDTDMAPAVTHPVTKTIINFLNERGIYPAKEGSVPSTPTPVIVSLSGGVDSMVIVSALANLKNACGYNLHLISVHIDYGNRPEAGAEAAYVGRYSERVGFTFQCRQITEVTRGVTARDDYERIAREMRYDSYREAIASCKSVTGDDDLVVGVMLGHHRGDLRENVLSNAHKGCGPLDLSGMTAASKNDGIAIYRPLLPLEKSFVLDYAHKFGVPYFKDTTPNWSTRGKLRNQLIPLLEEIYGEGSMNNLSNLATESDECKALLHASMLGPFLELVVRKPMGIIFDTAPWKNQPFFFWKFVIREALHSARLGMWTDKSTMSFLERVQVDKPKNGWLQCRKDYAVYLQQDGKVFVFYPSSFPWRKQEFYKVEGKALEFGETRHVGPWKVTAEILSEKVDSPDTFRLAQKAVPSFSNLMDGSISYHVSAPTWQEEGPFVPRPLVFSQFTKTSRPTAWKNSDLKVQTTLPLLGNDETAVKAMTDMAGSGLVHEMDGETRENPIRIIKVTLQLEPPSKNSSS